MKRHIKKGILHDDVELKPFTSWHIGGKAEQLYWPKDLEDLQQFLASVDTRVPITWLGLGSNVLVKDGGIKGIVLITQGALNTLEQEGNNIIAGAGICCAQVARFAARQNLIGGEFLAGIPGTVGGALYMNAGAFGGETWQKVKEVKLINRQGQLSIKKPNDYTINYRHIKGLLEDEWFVSSTFCFTEGEGEKGFSDIKGLLEKRNLTQPTGEPSCGSVFKNPPNNFAARLIDSLGLKGLCIGQAQVSDKHANFITNQGNASATDTITLITEIQSRVKAHYGILLEPEVHIIGEDG